MGVHRSFSFIKKLKEKKIESRLNHRRIEITELHLIIFLLLIIILLQYQPFFLYVKCIDKEWKRRWRREWNYALHKNENECSLKHLTSFKRLKILNASYWSESNLACPSDDFFFSFKWNFQTVKKRGNFSNQKKLNF